MNPKPFSSLNHFTTPEANTTPPPQEQSDARGVLPGTTWPHERRRFGVTRGPTRRTLPGEAGAVDGVRTGPDRGYWVGVVVPVPPPSDGVVGVSATGEAPLSGLAADGSLPGPPSCFWTSGLGASLGGATVLGAAWGGAA